MAFRHPDAITIRSALISCLLGFFGSHRGFVDGMSLFEPCPLNRQNGLYPHPTDCSSFITCADGSSFITSCPPTLHFNPEDQVCDWPENVRCLTSSGHNEMASTNSYDTRKHPGGRVTAKLVDQFVRGDTPYRCQQEHGTFPIAEDCGLFVRCTQWRTFLMTCSESKMFNPREGRCTEAQMDLVHCTPRFEFRCLSPRGLFADPVDRTKYYNCWNYRWYHQTCPDDLMFNPTKGWCDFPWNIEQEFLHAQVDPMGHGIQVAELQFSNGNGPTAHLSNQPGPPQQQQIVQIQHPDGFRDSPSVPQPNVNLQPPIHLFVQQPQPSFIRPQQFPQDHLPDPTAFNPQTSKFSSFESSPVGFGLATHQPDLMFPDLHDDFAGHLRQPANMVESRKSEEPSRNHWPLPGSAVTFFPTPFDVPRMKLSAGDLSRQPPEFVNPVEINRQSSALASTARFSGFAGAHSRSNLTELQSQVDFNQKPRKLHIEFRTPDQPVMHANAIPLFSEPRTAEEQFSRNSSSQHVTTPPATWRLPASLMPTATFEDEIPFVPVLPAQTSKSSHSIPEWKVTDQWNTAQFGVQSDFSTGTQGSGGKNLWNFAPGNQVDIGVQMQQIANHTDLKFFNGIFPNSSIGASNENLSAPSPSEMPVVTTTLKSSMILMKPRTELKRVGIRRYFNNTKIQNPASPSLIGLSVNRFLIPGGLL